MKVWACFVCASSTAGWRLALTCSRGLRSVYSEERVAFGLIRCFLHSLLIGELMGSWLLTVGCSLNSYGCAARVLDGLRRETLCTCEKSTLSAHYKCECFICVSDQTLIMFDCIFSLLLSVFIRVEGWRCRTYCFCCDIIIIIIRLGIDGGL